MDVVAMLRGNVDIKWCTQNVLDTDEAHRRVIKAKVAERSIAAVELFGHVNATVQEAVAAGLGKINVCLYKYKSSSSSLDVYCFSLWFYGRVIGSAWCSRFGTRVCFDDKVESTRFKLSKDDVAAVQLIKEILDGYNYSVSMTGCYTGSYACFMCIRWSPSTANGLSTAWSKAKDIIKAQAGPVSGQRSMSPQ